MNVTATTGGDAVTAGSAASRQQTEASGAAAVRLLRDALRGGPGGLASIRSLLQGTASSGHTGTSRGDGQLTARDESGTQLSLVEPTTTPKPPSD